MVSESPTTRRLGLQSGRSESAAKPSSIQAGTHEPINASSSTCRWSEKNIDLNEFLETLELRVGRQWFLAGQWDGRSDSDQIHCSVSRCNVEPFKLLSSAESLAMNKICLDILWRGFLSPWISCTQRASTETRKCAENRKDFLIFFIESRQSRRASGMIRPIETCDTAIYGCNFHTAKWPAKNRLRVLHF